MCGLGELRCETIARDLWTFFERSHWFSSTKQRKKRRKRDKLIISPIYKTKFKFEAEIEKPDDGNDETVKMMPKIRGAPSVLLPTLLLLSLLLLYFEISVVRFEMVNCQLVLDHPKNRNFKSVRHSISPIYSPYEPITRAPAFMSPLDMIHERKDQRTSDFKPMEGSNSNNHNNKHDDLLRKLSSTMLLESLLRHPFPINKSTFPPLTLSVLEHPKNRTFQFDSRASNIKPMPNTSKYKRFKQDYESATNRKPTSFQMDTSTTNHSVSNNHDFSSASESSSGSDSFNPKSLTYLVERLLSMNPPQDQTPTHHERPKSRPKYSHELTKLQVKPDYNKLHVPLQNKASPPLNLDLLIKDEYDSRVEPMLKSLKEQQKLSTPSRLSVDGLSNVFHTGASGHINHRGDEMMSGSTASTTLNPLNDTESPQLTTPNLFVNMPTTTVPPRISSSTTTTRSQTNFSDPIASPDLIDTAIDLDDFDEADEDEEDENEESSTTADTKKNQVGKSRSSMNSTTSPRKALQNVPPYQLGEMHPINRPVVDSSRMEAQATTSNGGNASSLNSKITKNSTADKLPVASNRGSLVFSDGGDEAERANRKRLNEANAAKKNKTFGNRSSPPPRKKAPVTNNQSSTTKSDKLGESFLLNQLFSTVNPLTELTNKLNEHELSASRDPSEFSPNNPLIYKGYVGKDDYLMSTTASDWSRPIGVRDNIPPMSHRYPYPTARPMTTPAPPTEPPSVPYNYFLNQPVTNAQSVPSMVIPTSDPPELTTRPPLLTTKFGSPAEKSDKRFSYQYPDKTKNQTQVQKSVWQTNNTRAATSELDNRIQELASLSENEDNGRRNESVTAANFHRPSDASGKNWAPTKIYHDESHKISSPSRPHQHVGVKFVAGNSSSPRLVTEQRGSRDRNLPSIKNLSPLDFSPNDNRQSTTSGVVVLTNATTADMTPPTTILLTDDSEDVDHNNGTQRNRNISHDRTRSNSQRTSGHNRTKTVDAGDQSEDYGSQAEGDNSEETMTTTMRKAKRPSIKSSTTSAAKHVDYDIALDNSNDPEDDAPDSGQTVTRQPPSRRRPSRPTKKTHGFVNHEPASSDVSYTEFNQKQNHTRGGSNGNGTRLQPKESIMIDGADSGTIQLTSGMESSGPTSFGSTIIPNSNFYGEASSESPTLDNSIPMLSPPISFKNNNNNHHHNRHHKHPEDPYQKIGSDNILSTLRQPFPSSPLADSKTTTTAITPFVSRDEAIGGDVKAANKTTNDRLVLALIAGFCVISVFCLVVAFMLMRCDDYRSVRNAERAALKLQRHRLKYTENHRINRLNRQSTDVAGRHLIDDMNTSSSLDSGINQVVGHANCTHAKSVHHHHHHPPPPPPSQHHHQQQSQQHQQAADSIDLDLWNTSRNRNPIPTLRDKSQHLPCTCANCMNQRCLCRDEVITNNGNGNGNGNANGAHLSWMHPYYYMQQQGRSRPLFGVGSSVGTFFPRRMEDQNFRDGGSVDAQILIDNQPPHNMRCTNPDHDHSHQLCHHHTHHKCRFGGHHRGKNRGSPIGS